MKKHLVFLLQVLAAFAIVDGSLLAGYYFWDSGRGGRAAKHSIAIGSSHDQVVAELGRPSRFIKLRGATIDGVPERWFYGPTIRWQSLKNLPGVFQVIKEGDPLVIGLLLVASSSQADPRDFVVDFDEEGRVIRVTKPSR